MTPLGLASTFETPLKGLPASCLLWRVCLERVAVHLLNLQAPARAQAVRQKVFKEEMHFNDSF